MIDQRTEHPLGVCPTCGLIETMRVNCTRCGSAQGDLDDAAQPALDPKCDCGHKRSNHYNGRGMCDYDNGSPYSGLCDCGRYRKPKPKPKLRPKTRHPNLGDQYND